jgi:hypothetical protein
MPNASAYEGPPEALAQYRAVVDASSGDTIVKGATNPYTSRNGHMFSFLDPTGMMALRLSDELTEQFLSEFESGPVMQYNSVMRGYSSIPADLLADTDTLVTWFDRSFEWIGTLPPKDAKRRK